MAKKLDKKTPTEADIRQYKNVPIDVAASYIGWSSCTIVNSLKQERAPFGFAAENPETGSFAYNISPELLINYRNGTLPTWRLNEVLKLAADGIQDLLDARMASARQLIDAALR